MLNEEVNKENVENISTEPNAVSNAAEPSVATESNLGGNVVNNSEVINNNLGSVPPVASDNKKKNIMIVLIIIILVLVIIIMVLLFKRTYNTDAYLDDTFGKITTNIETIFDSAISNNLDYDYTKDDLKSSGNIKLSIEDYDFLLDYDLESKLSDKYTYLNLDYNEDNSSVLKGSFIVDKDKLYIDSNDIYNGILSSDIEDYDEDDYNELINTTSNPENLKKLYIGLINHYKDALKEANPSAKFKGLTVEYTYEINDSNKDTIENKFKELVDNDEELVNILNTFDMSSDDLDLDLDNLKIEVVKNILGNNTKEFTITRDDSVITGVATDKNKYKVTIDDQEYNLEFSENIIYLNCDEFDFKIESDTNKGVIEVKDGEDSLNVTVTKNGNTNTLKATLDSSDGSAVLTYDISVDGKKIDANGSIDMNVDDSSIKLSIESNSEYGSNLVNKKTFSNTKDIEELTDEEYTNLYMNLYNKLEDSMLLSLVSSLYDSASNYESSFDYDEDGFALDANNVIDAAQTYYLSGTLAGTDTNAILPTVDGVKRCVSIDKLIESGNYYDDSYKGYVVVVKNGNIYSYYVYMTDGEYQVVNAGGDYSVTSSDIETYSYGSVTSNCPSNL